MEQFMDLTNQEIFNKMNDKQREVFLTEVIQQLRYSRGGSMMQKCGVIEDLDQLYFELLDDLDLF